MKTILPVVLLTMIFSSLFLPQRSFAQGSLMPPAGPPGPTMKTADQIEPRIIVNAANTPGDSANSFVISQPGSYYLTTNIVGVSGKNGIRIYGNNIRLDLNGFSLLGVTGSLGGIDFPYVGAYITNQNVEVRNGLITGWPGSGISSGYFSSNLLFDHLNVSSNNTGIFSASGDVTVRNCVVSQNSYRGINCDGGSARITGCTIENNAITGILMDGSLADCLVRNNGSGIVVLGGSVTSCTIIGNGEFGIIASGPTSIIGNTCVKNNTKNTSDFGGIIVDAGQCRIENNHLSGNGVAGIKIQSSLANSKNVVIKNTVSGNGASNYIVPGGNVFGPIANDASGGITNSSPWGNFSF